jgi:hypothetical protein
VHEIKQELEETGKVLEEATARLAESGQRRSG